MKALNFKELAEELKVIQKRNFPLMIDGMLLEWAELTAETARYKIIGRLLPLGPISRWPGWEPLKQSTIDQKAHDGLGKNGNPNSMLYATGKLEQSIEFRVNKQAKCASVGSMLKYALFLERGTVKMPPRPFLGPAGYLAMEKLYPRFEKMQGRVLRGKRAF